MAFQIKNFVSITASMVNRIRATTALFNDFNPGAVARTLVEAPAQEIDELYQQVLNAVVEAIPVSVYNSFSFPALVAVSAVGSIRVVVTAATTALTIPAGSVFTQVSGPQTYASTGDATIGVGATYVDVPVAAVTAGAAGNIPPGSAFTLSSASQNFVSASNLVAIQGGADAETPAAQKVRFNAFIQTLARGTIASLEYGASTAQILDVNGNITERVAFANVVEPYVLDDTQPIAQVDLYVHNGVGSTSGALVALVQKIIYGYYTPAGVAVAGYKAAGVPVTVAAATEVDQAVTASLTAAPGYVSTTLATSVEQAIAAYLLGLPIGASVIRAEMIALAMGVLGVSNFVLAAPASDVTSTGSQKPMPGTFTITETD